MKEININLGEEKELSIEIAKIMKRRNIKRIINFVLLLIFSILITMLFTKIGKKLDAEFLFGQLCVVIVFGTSYLYNYLITKSTYTEIESLIFNDEEVMQNITNEINKYEEKKD